MATKETIKRYHLIIRFLKKKPAPYLEVEEFLMREGEIRGLNFNFSERTFKRDREAIDLIYEIEIAYVPAIRAYKIIEDDSTEVDGRLLEAFDMIDTFGMGINLKEIVLFEKRKALGTEHIHGLVYAIQNQFQLQFWYHSYHEKRGALRTAEPYALKEFKQRWYLLAYDNDNKQLKTFALDRLTDLHIGTQKFITKSNLEIRSLYNNCFGIFLPDKNQKVEQVVLSFSPFKGKYIKSLQLHHSQKEIIDNEHEYRISLDIYVTYDFILEVISYSLDVKVIEPLHLAETIKEHHKGAIENY